MMDTCLVLPIIPLLQRRSVVGAKPGQADWNEIENCGARTAFSLLRNMMSAETGGYIWSVEGSQLEMTLLVISGQLPMVDFFLQLTLTLTTDRLSLLLSSDFKLIAVDRAREAPQDVTMQDRSWPQWGIMVEMVAPCSIGWNVRELRPIKCWSSQLKAGSKLKIWSSPASFVINEDGGKQCWYW